MWILAEADNQGIFKNHEKFEILAKMAFFKAKIFIAEKNEISDKIGVS
jgi:hypothetical protein